MLYGLLNLGSIVVGVIAWIFPIVNLVKKREENKLWIIFSAASLSACAVSLWMQMMYTNHLIRKEDWSALMDTNNSVIVVSLVLLLTTLILNAVTVFRYSKKEKAENNDPSEF